MSGPVAPGAVLVAALLLGLALVDGACSVFRASVGRTGLIRHRPDNALAVRRGGWLALLLIAPAMLVAVLDLAVRADRLDRWTGAGTGLLAVYLPYAALVGVGLLVYRLLHWRLRYLASAVLLGPFTLIRPLVAAAGVLVGLLREPDPVITVTAVLALAGVLAVEPLAGRRWYRPAPLSGP